MNCGPSWNDSPGSQPGLSQNLRCSTRYGGGSADLILLISSGSNPERIHSEAAFASLCGVSPVPDSSGKTYRHRLKRGGDRQVNAALHRIVLVRLSHDLLTKGYMSRLTSEGMSKTEVIRCLKRYVARAVLWAIKNSFRAPSAAP